MGEERTIHKIIDFLSWHINTQYLLTPIAVVRYHFTDKESEKAGFYVGADFLCFYIFGLQIARIQIGEWEE